MALKDIWSDKQNDVDFVAAEDINSIAQAVIALEGKIELLPITQTAYDELVASGQIDENTLYLIVEE